MGHRTVQCWEEGLWALIGRQHGVVSRRQLLERGVGAESIKHRIGSGRLFPLHRGVYAAGRPWLGPLGEWMAAVLACGPGAVLSHRSAGQLWGLVEDPHAAVELSAPVARRGRRPGLLLHRRRAVALADATSQEGIPVTSVARTIIDLGPRLSRRRLERVISEADKLELLNPAELRTLAVEFPHFPGARLVAATLDRRTFRLTDSELERAFLRLVADAGLGPPRTRAEVDGMRLDFLWPRLGLVVETDGLRYHRTAAQQALDRERDQRLTALGLTVLRFTHSQVHHEGEHVRRTVAAVAGRLGARSRPSPPGE